MVLLSQPHSFAAAVDLNNLLVWYIVPYSQNAEAPGGPEAEENWEALAPARRQGHLVSFPQAPTLSPQQSIDPVLASGHHRETDNRPSSESSRRHPGG
ncbi:unnamed protein product [Rangifer tarandus platyrhynchus]|uniref:Uncharacterized protein n=2 Tax=Rangifer tarandus platyrhynchus TaxID=3082113 RepID=A0ABN8Z097_RANTA|nr:unnamed protein product [Rangifer tarandus platyrhynchus]CAI9705021.1 unnamed protein product [Rangifer tarandus platyrhynchus]